MAIFIENRPFLKEGLISPSYNLRGLSYQDYTDISDLLDKDREVLVWVHPTDCNANILGATQSFVDLVKLKRAILCPDRTKGITGILSIRTTSKGKQKIELFITDGHHRGAVNILNYHEFPVLITGLWNQDLESRPKEIPYPRGFNFTLQQIETLISGLEKN